MKANISSGFFLFWSPLFSVDSLTRKQGEFQVNLWGKGEKTLYCDNFSVGFFPATARGHVAVDGVRFLRADIQ